jgi:hypothetical protein
MTGLAARSKGPVRGTAPDHGLFGTGHLCDIEILVLEAIDIISNKTFMQVAGSGWRVSTNDFQNIPAGRQETQDLLLRYVQLL